MKNKLQSSSKLSKAFTVTSALLILMPIFFYVFNVVGALSMDKSSYNCTSDSMMMQLCHDPLGSSVGWTILYMVIFGLPLFVAWVILGAFILLKRTNVLEQNMSTSTTDGKI